MNHGAQWTARDLRILKDMIASGNRTKVIAALLGRTPRAVDRMAERLRLGQGPERLYRRVTIDQPIKPPPEQIASEALRVRTIKAIMRFANDNHINVDEAAAFLLSGADIPILSEAEADAVTTQEMAA